MKRKADKLDITQNDQQVITAKEIGIIFAQLTRLAETVWNIEDAFVNSPIKPPISITLTDIFESLWAYFRSMQTKIDSQFYSEKLNKISLSVKNTLVETEKRQYSAEKTLKLTKFKVDIAFELMKISAGLMQQIIIKQLSIASVNYYLNRQHLYYKNYMRPRIPLPQISEKTLEELSKVKFFHCLKKHEFYLTRNFLTIALVFCLLKIKPSGQNTAMAILFSFVGREIPLTVQEEIGKEIIDFLTSTSPLSLDPVIMQGLQHLNIAAFGTKLLTPQSSSIPKETKDSVKPDVHLPCETQLNNKKPKEIKYPLTKIGSQDDSNNFFSQVKSDLYLQIRTLLGNKKSNPNNCILLCTALIHYINLGQLPTATEYNVNRMATVEDYSIDALYSPVPVKVEPNNIPSARLKTPTMVTTSVVLTRNHLLNTAIDHGIPARESFVTAADGHVDPEREIILLDGIEDTDLAQEGVRFSNLNSTLKAHAQKSETGFLTAILNLCRIQQNKQKTAPAHSILILATIYEVVYCDAQYFNPKNIDYTRSKVFTGALSKNRFISEIKSPKPSQDIFGDITFLDPTGYLYTGLLQPPTPKIKKEPVTIDQKKTQLKF